MIIDIAQYALLALLVVFAFLYMTDWLKGEGRINATWLFAQKTDRIPSKLKRYYKRYPDKDRFLLFWLQVERLKNDVPHGAFAELGVYRGETAAVLHALDPARKLFLLDTFEGFRLEDLEKEERAASAYTQSSFADTSPQIVLEKIGTTENVFIHKGDIAEIVKRLPEQTYALVSMDMDLGAPTAAGLAYFYPRMEPGGVIIIHDYNPKWPGLVSAVDEFLAGIAETAVLIPDRECSLVIVKNKEYTIN